MADLALSFDKAHAFLERKRQVKYGFAEHTLSNIKNVVSVYIAYSKIFPDDYRSRLEGILPGRLVEIRNKKISLPDKCVEAIGKLFPINECMLEEVESHIWIEPQSPSMSWEEFDELLEDDEENSYFSGTSALLFPVMIWSIGNSINSETWEKLNRMFEWDVAWPEKLIKTKQSFDHELLQKNLERAGLGDFMTSIKIAWRATDNYFFDFDENDSYEADAPTFDAESICRLYNEWQAAGPIGESDTRAMLMLRQDPSLLQRVVNIMSKSLIKPTKAKTLVEVFTEQEAQNG